VVIAELVEHTEAAAYVDLFRAAPPSFGLEVQETDGVTALLAPGIDVLLFNRVIGLGVGRDGTPDQVEALVARYRAAGVRNFGVQLSPAARPSSLPEMLAGCGLQVRDYWTKVYRPAEPGITLPTDLRSVGRANWHHYMAWDGEAPAAVAALFIRDGAGWLGDGAALGCRWFATETGQDWPDKPNPSFHNMQRAGFAVAYQRPNYMPPATRA